MTQSIVRVFYLSVCLFLLFLVFAGVEGGLHVLSISNIESPLKTRGYASISLSFQFGFRTTKATHIFKPRQLKNRVKIHVKRQGCSPIIVKPGFLCVGGGAEGDLLAAVSSMNVVRKL